MRLTLLVVVLMLAACESLPPIPAGDDPCAAAEAMARDPNVGAVALIAQQARCLRWRATGADE